MFIVSHTACFSSSKEDKPLMLCCAIDYLKKKFLAREISS